jgi:hypothetical protein
MLRIDKPVSNSPDILERLSMLRYAEVKTD